MEKIFSAGLMAGGRELKSGVIQIKIELEGTFLTAEDHAKIIRQDLIPKILKVIEESGISTGSYRLAIRPAAGGERPRMPHERYDLSAFRLVRPEAYMPPQMGGWGGYRGREMERRAPGSNREWEESENHRPTPPAG